MNPLHYAFIACFALLAINKGTRKACMVYLVSYFIYSNLIFPMTGFYYYHFCALLSLVTGLIIINKHFIVGCLSLFLIPTNLIGYFLFYKYYEPTIYDNIALTIILMQLLTLTIRAIHGIFTGTGREGILERACRLFVVRIIVADSMDQNKTTME